MSIKLDTYQSLNYGLTNQQLIRTQSKCRICLQQSADLISLPCNCKNDLGTVHLKCFSKWISASTPAKVATNVTQVKCQLCLKNMKVQVETKLKIKKCYQIRKNYNYCQIVSAIVSILVILFLIFLCIRGIIMVDGGVFIMYILYGVAIAFLLVILKVSIQLTLRMLLKTQIILLKFIPSTQQKPQYHQKN